MALLEEISKYLQQGRAKNVKELVQRLLMKESPTDILNEGLWTAWALS